MKWPKRSAELKRLRKKHGPLSSVVSLPEPCSPSSVPSLSATGVAKIAERKRRAVGFAPPGTVVGTPHKQGPMVMFNSELPWAGGKKS